MTPTVRQTRPVSRAGPTSRDPAHIASPNTRPPSPTFQRGADEVGETLAIGLN